MDFDGSSLLKLAELLKPQKEFDTDSDSEDDARDPKEPECKGGKTPKQSVYSKLPPEKPKFDVNDPESEEALYFSEQSCANSDWRKTPQWEVAYKQQVSASDVFLQMSGKSTSTASCEDMIIKINLPEEDFRNIDLKITETCLKLVSPKYKLEVPLPQPVDPQRGNAQWDKDAEKLVVTLRMNREFDFINF
ncbi:hypothetical protein PPYR_06376 [Photinus pyralis]|uniref:PIH1D1/2/3 CS-like domain-containing protein n=1 Tax=Photinus pyralis TaxID=7054 RepID=A0A5N4ATJ5_PHOPY|nr:protein PIH1D3-like [Photinus pyralis]XP_031344516.1 protein PIH1D3-like [Photinus pyralis]KAB0800636.1 hypothetical protein PPYR_06376 [Photinus pyralis]